MKKLMLCVVLSVLSVFSSFALEGYETRTFHQVIKENFITIDLAYTEETRNLIVVYTVKHMPFDEGDAVAATRESVQKFADENGFKHFKAFSPDVIKYHGKDTELTRFLVLSK
ncbi:MAG: hypothetical protein EWM51_12230 [Treponema sp.]|nr:MAG: hypothetical protein EWM51_12230 [Treponema sp.]